MANQKVEKAPKALYDGDLLIGDIDIPCYVLEDERRILSQGRMISGLGMAKGTAGRKGGDRLASFVGTNAIKPFVSNELTAVISEPIIFQPPTGGIAYGYEATILADICNAVLDARKAGTLHYQQVHIADRCEILLRSFAKVGIIALVDEATGFQYIRARRNLEKILEKYISEDLRQWAKTFPDEFYQELFRLRKWQYLSGSVQRPSVVGHLTNDIVYERLAPGVLKQLQKKNPTLPTGRRRHHHHRWLTEDVGHPRLREHLAAVIALMKASSTWSGFKRSLERAFPKLGETLPILFPDEEMDGE